MGIPGQFSVTINTTCTHADQDRASQALRSVEKNGLLVDAAAFYIIRRFEIEQIVADEYGSIGVTQETIDIFTSRLRQFENAIMSNDGGTRTTGTIGIQGGQIILSEQTPDAARSKYEIAKADLDFLRSNAVLLPAVARTDPHEVVLLFRNEKGGRFFDDIFAAEGAGRVLISDDFHLRHWAESFFDVRSAWVQALLFHLEEAGRISIQDVVRFTIQLAQLGQDALSTNAQRILVAAEMLDQDKLSENDFEQLCSIIGQPGADLRSHFSVSLDVLDGIWALRKLRNVRERSSGIILRCLTRNQGEQTKAILDHIEQEFATGGMRRYLGQWRHGHFLR